MSTQSSTPPNPASMSLVEAMRGGRPQPVQPQVNLVKPVPIKLGFFGGQGSGKSTSAALLAAALSKECYGGAPVFVTDTEPGWQFLDPLIFKAEGIELIQRTEPTFKAMVANLKEAETLGCCVWAVDSLTIIWQELMRTFQAKLGYIPIDKWGDIKGLWNDYVTLFLNSKMNCFALGRLGNDMEEVADEAHDGKTKLVKVGTKFKAGGGESFGYEPHLLLEMSLERKPKVVRGSKYEGEGRMVHRVDVLKDRTWALNAKTMRWSDKPGYQKGGYRTVWESIKPHFDRVQTTMKTVEIKPGTSQELITSDGNSEWYQRQKRLEVLRGELHASTEMLFGGQTKEAKRLRMLLFEKVFGFKSKEAADAAPLDVIERGVRIVQLFEKRVKECPIVLNTTEENILAELEKDIAAFDGGTVEEADFPF